jgi:MFS family permease
MRGIVAALRPQEEVSEQQLRRGLRMLLFDGVFSQTMGVFTSGAFLVAFALLLGASNTIIGLLAAIGPLTQVLQIPTIFLVERAGLRKLLVVSSSFLSRLAWPVVAVLPWLVAAGERITVLLICLFAYFALGTVSSCAFNSWMRDLVPKDELGSYFGKRLAVMTTVGAILTVGAGFWIQWAAKNLASEFTGYSVLFLLGALFGIIGVYFLSRIPEPRMRVDDASGVFSVLAQPFRVVNFRHLLAFLGSWNFAINLAAPFFVVYMITRLQLSMALVLALSVLSQIVNVVFLRLWGRLADQFSNKSVLGVSGPLFVLSILLWPFLTLPEKHTLTLPLLVVIHVLAGMSTAGVTLCSGNIALKLAPRGQATSFLAVNALVNGVAATLAPILAGIAADAFAEEEMTVSLRWLSVGVTRFDTPAIALSGLDFVFVAAVLLGLYALHRLLAVREEGEVEERVVTTELYAEVRKAFRHVSNVAGLRHLTYFPYERLMEIVGRRRGGLDNGEK